MTQQYKTPVGHALQRLDNYMENKLGQDTWDGLAIILYGIAIALITVTTFFTLLGMFLWLNDYVATALVLAALYGFAMWKARD